MAEKVSEPSGSVASCFKSWRDKGMYADDFLERLVYSHDLAPLPGFIRLVLDILPAAVVQPKDVDDVVNLVNIARMEKIPLVPRGAGTSGFGGALPVKGGLVVETIRLNKVTVDPERAVVMAGSGARWSEVIREAEKAGFFLRTYPSSAPSATVGGWVSSGGIGIGTLKYGSLASQLESVEIVLPSGRVATITKSSGSPPFDVVLGSEGIFGVITSATVTLGPPPELIEAHFTCFDKLSDAVNSVQHMLSRGATPYYIEILDPYMLELKKQLGLHQECKGWCALFAFEGDHKSVARDVEVFTSAVRAHGGVDYGADIGSLEWERRFKTLDVKPLGPTILGNEVIVPLGKLEVMMSKVNEIKRRFKTRIGVYLVPVSPSECLVMPLIFTDERNAVRYFLALAASVEIVREAIGIGGRPYGYGLWNAPFAPRTIPKENLVRLVEYKRALDPEGLMNPGKILEPKLKFGLTLSERLLLTLVFFARLLSIFEKSG